MRVASDFVMFFFLCCYYSSVLQGGMKSSFLNVIDRAIESFTSALVRLLPLRLVARVFRWLYVLTCLHEIRVDFASIVA